MIPKIERNLQPRNLIKILFVLAVGRGLLYTFVVPPWQHPDEPLHFEHVRLIADTGTLPTKDDISIPLRLEVAHSMAAFGFWDPNPPPVLNEEVISIPGASVIGVYTLAQPRLYYILASIWLRPWLGLSIEGQLIATRLFSVLLNLIVISAAYKTAVVLFEGKGWVQGAIVALVVFHPVNTDIMSAVNNDTLVNAIGAVFFMVMAMILRWGFSIPKGLAVLGLAVGSLFVKTTGLVLIAALPIALGFYLWITGHRRILLFFLILSVLAGVFSGVILAQSGITGVVEDLQTTVGSYLRVNLTATLDRLTEPEAANIISTAAPLVFKSFYAVFGWRGVFIAQIWYWILLGLTLFVLIGLAIRAVRWLRDRARQDRTLVGYGGYALSVVGLASLLAVVRSLAAQGLGLYLSHGRYILIALLPFAVLFIVGLLTWTRDKERVATACQITILGLFAFDAVCFWGFLVPVYY
jgi:hypothetical protein